MKIIMLVSVAVILFSACENKNDYDIKSGKNYELNKTNLQQTEQKTPSGFLTVMGERKKNIIGQTIVKVQITNKAKIVAYKDVVVKIAFYSQTGTLLEEDKETVYETILPGATAKFKSKYFTPQGTDSVVLKIITAKF